MLHIPFCLSPTREEIEEVARSSIGGFNTSKEEYTNRVQDDVLFLAPDEPIICGKQGNINTVKG